MTETSSETPLPRGIPDYVDGNYVLRFNPAARTIQVQIKDRSDTVPVGPVPNIKEEPALWILNTLRNMGLDPARFIEYGNRPFRREAADWIRAACHEVALATYSRSTLDEQKRRLKELQLVGKPWWLARRVVYPNGDVVCAMAFFRSRIEFYRSEEELQEARREQGGGYVNRHLTSPHFSGKPVVAMLELTDADLGLLGVRPEAQQPLRIPVVPAWQFEADLAAKDLRESL